MVTVSTKTFYNYVHQGRTSIKPLDLPRMVRRKTKKNWKSYIPKRQKGTSITERPEYIKDREEFGHWEGAPKITEELKKKGHVISEKTVGNYMHEMHIKAHYIKPWTKTTVSKID